MAKSILNIENYNNDFLIIKSEDQGLLAAAGRSIFEKRYDFADEVIVSETEVCIKLNDRFDASRLIALDNFESATLVKKQSYNLPVYFEDTEDWNTIVAHSGLEKEEFISKILESKLSVAMFGFLPGFVYLDGLDASLHVPRKNVPAKYVKANSVAIGGKYIGIYSIDSPGGWQVVGRIPTSILSLKSLPPVDFNIGDVIRLESIDQHRFEQIIDEKISFKTYNSF